MIDHPPPTATLPRGATTPPPPCGQSAHSHLEHFAEASVSELTNLLPLLQRVSALPDVGVLAFVLRSALEEL